MTHVPSERRTSPCGGNAALGFHAEHSRGASERLRLNLSTPDGVARVQRWRWRKESPPWDRGRSAAGMVLRGGIEPTTSPLPRECSTTELPQRRSAECEIEDRACIGKETGGLPAGSRMPSN